MPFLHEIVEFTPYDDFVKVHKESGFKAGDRYICIPYNSLVRDVLEAGGLHSEIVTKIIDLFKAEAGNDMIQAPEPQAPATTEATPGLAEQILSYVKNSSKEVVTKSQVITFVNRDQAEVVKAIKALRDNNLLDIVGHKRSARYVLGKAVADPKPTPAASEDDLDDDMDDGETPLENIPIPDTMTKDADF